MDTQIIADYKQLLGLCGALAHSMQALRDANAEMLEQCTVLGKSFRDERFDLVKQQVTKAGNTLDAYTPHLNILIGKLDEYGEKLGLSDKLLEQ